ncbi:MAG: Transcriptional regulator/antitoxin, MazE [Verrucomicrobia bacterium]|nr:Transcriptional regulator/antitoxin, MazE [Verrucomicrobiota bacterium]
MLESCGFAEEADLQIKNGALILRPIASRRTGWREAFQEMTAVKDDVAVHEDAAATTFDREEWEW